MKLHIPSLGSEVCALRSHRSSEMNSLGHLPKATIRTKRCWLYGYRQSITGHCVLPVEARLRPPTRNELASSLRLADTSATTTKSRRSPSLPVISIAELTPSQLAPPVLETLESDRWLKASLCTVRRTGVQSGMGQNEGPVVIGPCQRCRERLRSGNRLFGSTFDRSTTADDVRAV